MAAELAASGETADAEITEETQPPAWGHVIIEWPAPGPGPHPRPLIGWKCALFNADTGEQFYSCRKIEIHADAEHLVTADLTMLADDQGHPHYGSGTDGRIWFDDDGKVLEGTFRFLVTGMRVRS